MPCVLHILTRRDDLLPQEIIRCQRKEARNKIEVIDLTKAKPDYKELLEKIFASDSIECW